MKCKKHGEIGNNALVFSLPKEYEKRVTTKKVIEISESFCIQCIMELLKKEIGTIKGE